MKLSKIHHRLAPGESLSLTKNDVQALAHKMPALNAIGFGIKRAFASKAMDAMGPNVSFAMDADITATVNAVTSGVPVQFLQAFLPGFVYVITTARRGDMLAPVLTPGSWSDEEIVLQSMEFTGTPTLYTDHGGVNFASWSNSYERRTIVRFMLGLEQTMLDDERSAAANINSGAEKRAALAMAFEQLRNYVFFNGYDDGSNRTYGILNDPNLAAYVTVADGASTDTLWSTKTVNEIITDILTAIAALRSQSGSNVDPERDKLILAVPSDVKDQMNNASTGNGVIFTPNVWLKENYPNIEVIAIPEFNEANGTENVFYLYAPTVADSGTDGGDVIDQLVPAKMMALNSVPTMKGSQEGYAMATAGCLVKRPYAVVRYTGI